MQILLNIQKIYICIMSITFDLIYLLKKQPVTTVNHIYSERKGKSKSESKIYEQTGLLDTRKVTKTTV